MAKMPSWINQREALHSTLHQKSNLQCNFVELNCNSFTNDITVSIFHLHPSIQRGGLGKRKYFLRYNEINGWGNLIFHSLQSQVSNLYWWIVLPCLVTIIQKRPKKRRWVLQVRYSGLKGGIPTQSNGYHTWRPSKLKFKSTLAASSHGPDTRRLEYTIRYILESCGVKWLEKTVVDRAHWKRLTLGEEKRATRRQCNIIYWEGVWEQLREWKINLRIGCP